MLNHASFRSRLNHYISIITPERVVGASGLATLCALSIVTLTSSNQILSVSLAQWLGGLGLNVLAGVLQKGYQDLLSETPKSDLDRMAELALSLTKDIRRQAKLRVDIGKFLNTVNAFQIAEEVVKGNPAIHGWLLVQIFKDVTEYRADFDQIHKTLAEINSLINLLKLNIADENIFIIPPLPPQGVLGRENDLAILQKLLVCDNEAIDVPPVSVLGMGGIGKTTLAIALGHSIDVNKVFPHGVLWTELGPKPKLRQRLDEWGQYLKIDLTPLPDVEACSRRLRDALHHRRMLIIVDDVWDSPSARLFRIGGPNCRLLFTTRELSVANDLVTPSRVVRISSISPDAAINLLRTLAPHVVDGNETIAIQLCKKLEFLPLAITLAGRYLANEALTNRRKHTLINELLSRAEDRLKLSQYEARLGIEDTHPSLWAILGLSVERLKRTDQERFAMLSVFGSDPLTWSMDAAAYVWNCSNDDTDATLTRLMQHGLVEQWNDRYRMHALFADYSQVLLKQWDL